MLPACVALVLLTLLAGALQYHWVNRVSDADRRQRHDFLAATLRNFSGDFREAMLRLIPFFRPPPAGRIQEPFESSLFELTRQWRNAADRPQLLNTIGIGTQSDKGIVFKRLRPGDDQFREEAWPNEFALYRTIIEKRLRLPGGELPLFPHGFAFELFQGRPVLIFPLVTDARSPAEGQPPRGMLRPLRRPLRNGTMIEPPPLQPLPGPREMFQALRPAPAEGIRAPELKGWCFLEIDEDYLREHLLPELVARHYGPEARSGYHVAIVSSQPLSIIYTSEPTLTTESLSEVDAGIVLLEANMMQGRPGPLPPGPPPAEGPPPNGHRPGLPPPPGPQPFISGPQGVPITQIGPSRGGGTVDNAWLLIVKNKSRSLESMVEQSRRRHLALSFGILLLLVGSTVMLMLATARARSLARQQMEFVAGVSHELRTPLTVIHSTSYNLSKGMIQDPGRVQQYGHVIQREARRLINQVERMLSFAGIQSGRRIYDPQPTNVVEMIDRALAEYANAFADEGWQVDKQIDEHLPWVLTDAAALESALTNLFENALKYASQGKWLSVSARAAQNKKGKEVQITVADRGPGIPAKDLPHIFEPFYRGQDVIASPISGAGLGLSLVQRQLRALGGRATVRSSPNHGSSFTLHLPVLDQTAPASVDRSNSNAKQDPGD
ncbi:MAG TPA: HAMP domain-containing sensor histidine kinase [Pyrinomonadaceae bacterium]|nr:HAMP domain-containing sensor histidine kinase [Pyrinomonadaceae bacterium]